MEGDTLRRDALQLFFKRIQVARPPHFGLVWHAKHKVAEAQLLGEDPPQIAKQRWRTLAQKGVSLSMRSRSEFSAAGL